MKNAKELGEFILRILEEDKAENIVIINLAGKTSFANYMIIADGRSSKHISSIAHSVQIELKKIGVQGLPIEGEKVGDWVLLDAGDVVVHLFRPEVREIYNLEDMWTKIKREE